jgi:hypothetical protein
MPIPENLRTSELTRFTIPERDLMPPVIKDEMCSRFQVSLGSMLHTTTRERNVSKVIRDVLQLRSMGAGSLSSENVLERLLDLDNIGVGEEGLPIYHHMTDRFKWGEWWRLAKTPDLKFMKSPISVSRMTLGDGVYQYIPGWSEAVQAIKDDSHSVGIHYGGGRKTVHCLIASSTFAYPFSVSYWANRSSMPQLRGHIMQANELVLTRFPRTPYLRWGLRSYILRMWGGDAREQIAAHQEVRLQQEAESKYLAQTIIRLRLLSAIPVPVESSVRR